MRCTSLARRLSALSTALSLAVSFLVAPFAHGACAMRGLHHGPATHGVTVTGDDGGSHAGHVMGSTDRSTHGTPNEERSRPDAPCVAAGVCTPVGTTVVALVTGAGAPLARAQLGHNVTTPPSFLLPPDRPPPRA